MKYGVILTVMAILTGWGSLAQPVWGVIPRTATPSDSQANAWPTPLANKTTPAAFPFYDGFESGVLSNCWTTNSTGAGRIRLTNPTNGFEGNRSLFMDSASGSALNEATLTLNLAGQTSVIFRCWTRDYSDEAHPMPESFVTSTNADGIAVSADGLLWHRLVDLAALGNQSVYTNLVVDLAAFAADRSLPLTSTFQIRFQQYDSGAYPARGRSFDHISLTPALSTNPTVICAQGFEGETGDNWGFRIVPSSGQIAVSTNRKYSGTRSLKMVTSSSLGADPYIEFDNVAIDAYRHVRLTVAFSSHGPDYLDDLYLDISYDNGTTWSGTGSVALVKGYNNISVPFGETKGSNTVASNPWIVEIPEGTAQIKARLRFDEYSAEDGNLYPSSAADTNFVDHVVLDYLPGSQPPMLVPIDDKTAMVSNRLEFAVVATDIDAGTVTLAASNLPAGATFAPVTGPAPLTNIFEFTPDVAQADAVYPVVFHASDEDGFNSQTVTIRVLDRVVTFSTNRLLLNEESGVAALGVSLSRMADATVPLEISGTAALGADCTLSSTTLVFSAEGPVEQFVSVVAFNDDLPEGLESGRISVAINPESTGIDSGCEIFIRDDDSVTIATANLPSSGILDPCYQEAGERILQALGADVVAMQEFNVFDAGGQREFVDRLFGTNYSVYVEPDSFMPNGIISRWPILEAGEWDDPVLGDREFVWAKVDVPGGRPLYVVSIHLFASGTMTDRADEARALTNYLAQAGFHPSDLVVVCGDLNTESRSEAAFQVLKTTLSDDRKPADQFGDTDTNKGRDKPFDVVLPTGYLDARHLPVRFGGLTFPEGLVFDTRLWSEETIPFPAQVGDSATVNMSHMGVEKLFSLDRFVTILTAAGENGTVGPVNPEVGVGSNQIFTITAAPYFHVGRLATNGAAWTPLGQPAELVWTWSNAQDNAWLEVAFEENRTGGRDIPEWWLAAHGITNEFDAAEEADLDGDGIPTWQEFAMDTHPNDSNSFLHVDTMGLAYGPENVVTGYVMAWPASTGRVYDLRYRADLLGDIWIPMEGMTNLVATTDRLSVTNPFHAGQTRMIRIHVREP